MLPLHSEPAYIALAESLVDEALAPLLAATPPSALPDIRDFLVDELLCTEDGQATLRRLLPRPTQHASEETAILRSEVTEAFNRMSPRSTGAGLGLTIVRDIMTAHRGTLTVLATRGGGTTVRLLFSEGE